MNRNFYLLILICILSLAGCSGGSSITTDNPSSTPQKNLTNLPVGVSDYDSNGSPIAGSGILGLFSINVDKKSLTGELTPLRSMSSEDVLEVVDLTNFLQLAPCTNCVKVRGVELDPDGHVIVKIGIRHPFPAGDPFKPITGKNRADLHVFNVEGIVISDGTSPESFPGLGAKTGNLKLLNADGYTGYLDPSIDEFFPTEATIHPYITHFADYSAGNYDPSNPTGFASVTDPPPTGNLVMPMGSSEDIRNYVFDIPGDGFTYVFAVGCTYALSANSKNMRFTPEYRVPQHNKKAASLVNMVIDSDNLKGGTLDSEAQLTIKVLDINHAVQIGTALNEMRADSSVSKIEIEIPGVTLAPVAFSTTPSGGSGRDPVNPLTFPGTIKNEGGAAEGTYQGIVKVTDSYPVGLNVSPTLNGRDGIKRVPPLTSPITGTFDIPEFATYQRFEITVGSANQDPVAILAPDPAYGCDGAKIWFDGSASYDTDGTIVNYEFDFDLPGGIPSNFSADVSGADSRVQSSIYSVGTYTAALRVTDDRGGKNIDTVPVTITAIDGFDISLYPKTYVTDTSFSNIIFTPNGNTPTESQNRQLGVEAMARGSEYIYAAFYATGSNGNGVYIARSGDSGATWGGYNLVRALTPGAEFTGVAIDAVGSEVFVAMGETNPKSLYFGYNNNNGASAFTISQISDTQGYVSTSIAVDPFDTNNIYISVGEQSFWTHIEAYWIYVSNTGPAGPFTATRRTTWAMPPPYNYPSQGYTGELKVAPDRDVYYIMDGNENFEVLRSIDYGTTFTYMYQGWMPIVSWGRDSDYCFNPNDSEMIHYVITYRELGVGWRHVYYRSLNGGASWTVVNNNLHNTYTGYTNCAVTTDSNGNLYIVYNDSATGNAEVYGRYSTNNGQSFGLPIQISNDPWNDANVEIVTTTDGCDVVVGWMEDWDTAKRVVSRRG